MSVGPNGMKAKVCCSLIPAGGNVDAADKVFSLAQIRYL